MADSGPPARSRGRGGGLGGGRAGGGGGGGGGGAGGRIDGGEGRDAAPGGGAADLEAIAQGRGQLTFGRVDHDVHQPFADNVHDVRVAFVEALGHLLHGHADGAGHGGGGLRRVHAVAAGGEVADDRERLRLGAVGERQQDGASGRQGEVGGV